MLQSSLAVSDILLAVSDIAARRHSVGVKPNHSSKSRAKWLVSGFVKPASQATSLRVKWVRCNSARATYIFRILFIWRGLLPVTSRISRAACRALRLILSDNSSTEMLPSVEMMRSRAFVTRSSSREEFSKMIAPIEKVRNCAFVRNTQRVPELVRYRV